MQKVQCEILGISSSPTTGGAYAILLKEIDGNKRLPIIIGAFEAQAIAMEIEGYKPPRPLTHDLLKNLIENLGGTVVEVIIDELRENTFYAKIILEISSLTNEVDSRPSDAIALALRTNAPIYVAQTVMDAAAVIPSEEEQKKEALTFDKNVQKESEIPKTKQTKLASLQNKLREALESEDYERAAKIRDEIKRLSEEN